MANHYKSFLFALAIFSIFPSIRARPLVKGDDHPVSTFEIFFSQQRIINPCTGNPIIFDFCYFKMDMTRNADILSGYVVFQQTMRHEGSLHSQRNEGTFSVAVERDTKDYRAVMKYDVPDSPFNFIYMLDYTLGSERVSGVRLEEIQVGKC